MKCDHAKNLLPDWLDGLLLPLDRAAVGSHVAGCASCRDDAARLSSLIRMLDELPTVHVPGHFTDQVMARLPEMLPAVEGPGHLVRWGAAAVAAVAALAGALLFLPSLAGPSVARGTLGPVSASLRLGVEIFAATSTALASAVDACATALAQANSTAKLAFAVVFLLSHAGLALAVSRYRKLELRASRLP